MDGLKTQIYSIYYALYYFFLAYFFIRIYKALAVIVPSIFVHFLLTPMKMNLYMNSWTLITGATDGIGRAMAFELAKTRGIRKFYLIGRSQEKLDSIKEEMKMKFKCQVKTDVFDFDTTDYSGLPMENLKTMDIGVLINCAGIGPGVGNILEQEQGLPTKILRVNLLGPVKMLEIVGCRMIRRNIGLIINVASYTGWRPMPFLSTYPASKAALLFFTSSLCDEFRRTFVKVQALAPLFVTTKASAYEKAEANFFVVTPEDYAHSAVRCIGLCEFTTGCFRHDLLVALGNLIPPSLFKALYVPYVILGIHKNRVKDFRQRHTIDNS